jgi:glycosyltransferase involved in cell wall biosynthesis
VRQLAILGTRGIPASHGGFETFAEHLALWLTGKGWQVTVYCHKVGAGPVRRDYWQGIERVLISVATRGTLGTIVFDLISTWHAARAGIPALTLGYNTAVFWIMLRARGVKNVANMDGIEWTRQKWRPHERWWLWLNEKAGARLANRLVADHPEIARHLENIAPASKIATIPYGAATVSEAHSGILAQWGLVPEGYAIVIARPEPENSILEIVRAFSASRRNLRLVVLGRFVPETNPYHRQVMAVASDEVLFPGAIYDKPVVAALRFFAKLYVHGHTVGGTNPSLVEALGTANPVMAHDNRFNRWVAGPDAAYFRDETECRWLFETLLEDSERLAAMSLASRRRHAEQFTWERVLTQYERLLEPRSPQ